MNASPLRKWWRSAHRRRRHGLALLPPVTLPFPEDAARATVARYRVFLNEAARTVDTLTSMMSAGPLTPEECLKVVRRHVKRLQFDLAALEQEAVQP
ncbi:MAG: hypothetical protein WCG85_02370 [Polyangia bacterium]